MPEPRQDRPAEQESEARVALRSDERTRALADAPFDVVTGGLSNHAWMASASDGDYFVRLSPPDSDRLGVDRASECALLRIVAQAGLAPEVVRCDPAQRLLVTRRIAGRTLTRDEAIEPQRIGQLGAALRTLHALPVPHGQRRVDFAAQALRLEAQCNADAAVRTEFRDRACAAFATLERVGRPDTLCHNDLHHLNLVTGERLWLVDWEYGGAGDPIYDAASFLCQHDCGPRERDRLLHALGDDAGLDAVQLSAACWTFDYVQWLWYRAWPSDAGADPVYRERAAALERRLRPQAPR